MDVKSKMLQQHKLYNHPEMPMNLDSFRPCRILQKPIPFFSDITICLNKVLSKAASWEWTEQCENAFKLLKDELTKMPALQYPNPNKPFKLFTDVSKHSYSGILHQEEEGQVNAEEPKLIPIANVSGTFNKNQQLWKTTQKECYAIYRSVQKFTSYLAGTHIIS